MSGAQAERAAVRGTLSLAAALGRALRECRMTHADPIAAIRARLNAATICHGRVVAVERRTVGGFARGDAHFVGIGADPGHAFRIAFQNAYLIAERDGVPVVTTPDLITLLDEDTGALITTESLPYGLRVIAIAIPCTDAWRTPEGLALVGPRYFGYDMKYQPFRA